MDRFTRALLALAELSCYAFVGWTAGWYIGKGLRAVIDTADGLALVGDELHTLHTALDEQAAIARGLLGQGAVPIHDAAAERVRTYGRCDALLDLGAGAHVRCSLAAQHDGPHHAGGRYAHDG
jgi:hypothetical protein